MTKETEAASALVTLDDLNAEAACEVPFEFPFIGSKGEETGIFLQVLGGESETVKAATNKLMNERRRQEAIVAAQTRPGRVAPITPAEDDIAFGKKLSAVRLVGWRGIKEPHSPELALKLVTKNDEISAQVLEQSNKTANFTKPSSATS